MKQQSKFKNVFSNILDNVKNKRIVSELSNELSRKIMFSVISKPKSALEISEDTGLSQSTVYQKLVVLRELTLVSVDHTENTDKGRIREFFQSNIKKATIIISNEHPKIFLIHNKTSKN